MNVFCHCHPRVCDFAAARDMAIRALGRAAYDHARAEILFRDLELRYAKIMLRAAAGMTCAEKPPP